MTLSIRNPGQVVSCKTQSAVVDGDTVVLGTADSGEFTCAFPAGATPTGMLLGVVYKPGTTSAASVGAMVDVVLDGIYPVRVGAAGVTRGLLVTPDGATGTVANEAAGAGVNVGVLGIALYTGVSGDRVAVNIRPFVKQGA